MCRRLVLWISAGGLLALPAELSVALNSGEAPSQVRAAKRLYWEGLFEGSRLAFERVLATVPDSVEVLLSLGRIAELESRFDDAKAYYKRAADASPVHAEALLALSSVTTGPTRVALLRKVLALNGDARNSEVASWLAVERTLRGRTLQVVADARRPYRLSLSETRPSGGVTVGARIDGGPVLNLLVDSGAKGIVLNPRAAAGLDLELLTTSEVLGFGAEKAASSRLTLAAGVRFGELEIANVTVEVAERQIVPHADGVVGLEVFQDFVIHLDPKSRVLSLEPAESAPPCPDCTRIYRLGHLLLVPGKVNGESMRNFILDTGAAITLVSSELSAGAGYTMQLVGAQGVQEVVRQRFPLSLRIGRQKHLALEYGTLDTSTLSSRLGTEVAGSIGFSLLRDLTLTVDYRRGLVKFAKRR